MTKAKWLKSEICEIDNCKKTAVCFFPVRAIYGVGAVCVFHRIGLKRKPQIPQPKNKIYEWPKSDLKFRNGNE